MKVKKSIFLKFPGKYSTGIYIYQFMFLSVDELSRAGWPLHMGLVRGCTLLIAVIMHPVHVWIRKKLGVRRSVD